MDLGIDIDLPDLPDLPDVPGFSDVADSVGGLLNHGINIAQKYGEAAMSRAHDAYSSVHQQVYAHSNAIRGGIIGAIPGAGLVAAVKDESYADAAWALGGPLSDMYHRVTQGMEKDVIDKGRPPPPPGPAEFNFTHADASELRRRRNVFAALKAIDPLAGDHPKAALNATPLQGIL